MNGSDSSTETPLAVNVKKLECGDCYCGREGQVACSIGTKVFIFGGVEQGQGDEPKETNDLVVFDLETLKWFKPPVSGMVPPPRSAASLVSVGTKLYLFGGLSHMSGWFDDLFIFDTETNQWSILETDGIRPRARDKLQAVAIGTNIYYFGGFGPKSDEAEAADLEGAEDDEEDDEEEIPEAEEQDGAEFGWFNDLFVLDTVNAKWSQPMQMNLGVPTQRAAHGMCAIGNHLMIFGGRDIEDRQNDLHIFNVVTRKWMTDLNVAGPVPPPRSFHTLTAVGNKAVLFGGRGRDNQHFADFHVLDFDSKEWSPLKTMGEKPAGRGQHCAVTVGDSLFVVGGSGDFSQQTMQCQSFYTDAFLLKQGEICGGSALSNGLSNGSGDH